MNLIETIYLRASSIHEYENIIHIVNETKKEIKKLKYISLRLFKDMTIPSDFLIIFERKNIKQPEDSEGIKSIPALRLFESLKKIGLVNHSIFSEKGVEDGNNI